MIIVINIDQVKRLEQPLLVKLIDDGQLILETDLHRLTEAARKLGYAVIKEEDLEIREKESRELAYIKIQQAENLLIYQEHP